jgi:hypothetical protein
LKINILERRNFGGIDTMVNTTTATQRRDRRRELEEKYGLRSTTNNNVSRQENFADVISG